MRAEIPFAELQGLVRSGDAAAGGVHVTATSTALPQPRVTVTSDDGTYWLPALPPGSYDVTFSRSGLQTLIRRVELHAGETSRLDASLDPSEDEETVTKTALERSLFERPVAVWSLDAETADRLPLARDAGAMFRVAPLVRPGLVRVDGIVAPPLLDVLDAVQQSTVIESFGGDVNVITHSGGELRASLRATLEKLTGRDDETRFEATFGGPVLRDRVFAFGAAGNDARYAKLTASAGARHTLIASYLRGDRDDAASADYLLAATPRVTATASLASRETASVRAFASAGDHQLTAGAQRLRGRDALVINDRWSISPRWVVDVGARAEEGETFGTAGAVLDLGGRRIAARVDTDDEIELWYGQRLEANGYARAGLAHRRGENVLIVDAAFRFLVLTLGGNATLSDERANRASAWVLFDAPLLAQDVGVALVGRHIAGATMLDTALTYAVTRGSLEPFVKVEVSNAFGRRTEPRAWRFGLGARM